MEFGEQKLSYYKMKTKKIKNNKKRKKLLYLPLLLKKKKMKAWNLRTAHLAPTFTVPHSSVIPPWSAQLLFILYFH